MKLSQNAETAVRKIQETLSESLTDDQSKKITKVIEKALIDSVLETCQSSSLAINHCCSADQDMAHKLNAEIERSKVALIANLTSFR